MELHFEASPVADSPDARQAALLVFATVYDHFAMPEQGLKLVGSWKNPSGPMPGALRQGPGDGARDSSVALMWCSSTGEEITSLAKNLTATTI